MGRDPARGEPVGCDRRPRREAAARKRPRAVVLGWMAAHLLTRGDRGAENPLYNVAFRAGRELDWDVLARRFEDKVLNPYLPPA